MEIQVGESFIKIILCGDWLISILEAAGTVGACIIALVLALDGVRHKLDCSFIWAGTTDYSPCLLVCNTGSKLIVLRSVELHYNWKKIGFVDLQEKQHIDCIAIGPGEKSTVMLANEINYNLAKPKDKKKKKTLKIVIRTTSGKKFVIRQKYTYEQLQGRFFLEGLLSKK